MGQYQRKASPQTKDSQSIKFQVCLDMDSSDVLLLYPIFVDSVAVSAKPKHFGLCPSIKLSVEDMCLPPPRL